MSLSPHQQLEQLFQTSQDILILLPSHPDGDTLSAGWALALYLEQHEKSVTVAADSISEVKTRYPFLQEPKQVVESLSGARDFILSFNTKYNKIIGMRTEESGEEYRIYITPEHGSVDPRDFSFIPAKFKFDLVIVIGSPDKEHLGKLYEDNADIFYEAPVVNIDYHANNEHFGQINFTDLTASSCSEIVTGILEKMDQSPIGEDVSECLLAGIILATDSFQKKNTTPRALHTASHLMDCGADQQKIVRALYKTQPLHLLKLWGRIMSQLHWGASLRLVWAPVHIEDLVQSRAEASDLPSVLEKIKSHYSAGTFFALLFQESPQSMRIIFKAATPEVLPQLATIFPNAVSLHDTLTFHLSVDNFEEAEQKLTQSISTIVSPEK